MQDLEDKIIEGFQVSEITRIMQYALQSSGHVWANMLWSVLFLSDKILHALLIEEICSILKDAIKITVA